MNSPDLPLHTSQETGLELRGITGPQAVEQLLRRRAAQANLIPFTQFTKPDFEVSLHHDIIAETLEAVERGEKDRVLLQAPPRHTKSELTSRRFPAWYLGRNPSKQIIFSTYNAELAADFGEDVKEIVTSLEYKALFSTDLRKDVQSKHKWKTRKGGVYHSVGVGGAITGRGADVLIVDDPIKGDEDAASETAREKIWNWFSSTAYTRLMPGGRICIIMTRWHEDDLAGRLIAQMKNKPGADQYEIINLPAFDAERMKKTYFLIQPRLPTYDEKKKEETLATLNGALKKNRQPKAVNFITPALWPGWFPKERLDRIKANILERYWNALYMQDPTPDDGVFFKREMLRYWIPPNAPDYFLNNMDYKILPDTKTLRFYGTSDYAVTEDAGDYTVHCVWGVDYRDNIFLLDMWRKRTKTDKWVKAVIQFMKDWKPGAWIEEQGQIIKSVGPFLKKRMKEEGVYTFRHQYVSHRAKEVRAQSIRGRMQNGVVYLPLGMKEITDVVVKELMAFPNGKNDDIVDNFSLIGRALDDLVAGAKPLQDPSDIEGMENLTLEDAYRITERNMMLDD